MSAKPITPHQPKRFDGIVRRLQQFLHVNEIRQIVALIRYYYFTRIRRRMQTYTGPNVDLGENTLEYNLAKVRKSVTVNNRILHLVRPVAAIEVVATHLPEQQVLAIGPRAESELLAIAAYGFTWRNIRGLDLFSYSPTVDVGDMHALPYEDSSFDIIFNGWCLAYSDNQPLALQEMVRVAKPGGYIAIGQGYTRLTDREEVIREHGEFLGGANRMNEIDDILAPIADNIDKIHFRHDISAEDRAAG